MTNPPPVAPVEGHYARLRNGSVVGPMRKEYEDQYWFVTDLCDGVDWRSDGKHYHTTTPNPLDIIATISPADMQAVANGELERLRKDLERLTMALEFYADKANWRTTGHPQIDALDTQINLDKGRIAQNALELGKF